jgi:hypothetical protein
MSVYPVGIIPPETFPPVHEPDEPVDVLPPAPPLPVPEPPPPPGEPPPPKPNDPVPWA